MSLSWLKRLREDAETRFGSMGQQDIVRALIEVAEAAKFLRDEYVALRKTYAPRDHRPDPALVGGIPQTVGIDKALSRLQALGERQLDICQHEFGCDCGNCEWCVLVDCHV